MTTTTILTVVTHHICTLIIIALFRSTFALDLAYDEQVLSAQAITVQAALLYTSSAGALYSLGLVFMYFIHFCS